MIAQDYEASAQWTVTSRPSEWAGGRSQKSSTISPPSESSSEASEFLLNDTSDPQASPRIEEIKNTKSVTALGMYMTSETKSLMLTRL